MTTLPNLSIQGISYPIVVNHPYRGLEKRVSLGFHPSIPFHSLLCCQNSLKLSPFPLMCTSAYPKAPTSRWSLRLRHSIIERETAGNEGGGQQNGFFFAPSKDIDETRSCAVYGHFPYVVRDQSLDDSFIYIRTQVEPLFA